MKGPDRHAVPKPSAAAQTQPAARRRARLRNSVISGRMSAATESLATLANDWLGRFEAALRAGDAKSLGALFRTDCHWRDLLAFTWTIRTATGVDSVVAELLKPNAARGFKIDPARTAPREVTRA